MKTALPVVSVYYFTLLLSATSSVEDRGWLNSVVELVEMDYIDNCVERATSTWEELMGMEQGLTKKLERDKSFGVFASKIRDEVKRAVTGHALGQDDDILKRKVKLLLQPGDVLLDTEQWIKLVTFGVTSQHKLRFATNYDCGGTNCSLREFHISYARQQDEETLRRMKQSWERNLPDTNEYLEQILPLLRNSSKDYKTVEEYWDSLVEYEGAILKARELWDNVKPLYTKLHNYIALRLKGADAVGKTLPVHLLRSLNGDDWSNIIESLLPKHPAVYQKVHANLELMNLGGMKSFKAAAKLISDLKLGEIKPEVLSESVFNGTCPPTLIDWCKPNKVRIVSCKDVSIGNYLDAHEATMKILYKQATAMYSNNTFILREAPRYSAVYEAIPGFVSLLALSPYAIDRNGLFQVDVFNINGNHHRLILQLMLALRDLPKLNFYLAADEWRLKVLMGTLPPTSWSEFREKFSMLETSDQDLLSDPYVLLNKPFIGKFMGLILKYQIYQSFAEELESDDDDLLAHVGANHERLSETMIQGYSTQWPELVSDLLAQKENGLEYTGLTDYYRLLDEYLDWQLDPTNKDIDEINEIDDYIEPESIKNEEDFDLENAVEVEVPYEDTQLANQIETGEDRSKFGAETSTVAVLEIKNPIEAGDQKSGAEDVKAASYNVYWWIGIAVAIAVVVIIIAIIARKRHNHRKQLERQRENSRA
ncbi:unnamed protein product [Chilo suppressalis]|uniref:Angiotensin-converting enzyme n=1 Tax=Chilo suppressalis TaxID=168631 RepID=A0ABN8ECP5_CHISP|nr:unnamed protein product [Chilo suppressalis]